MACFSALLRARRHEEILALLQKAPFTWWTYRQWGVRALVALGRPDEAIAYAEASRGVNDSPVAVAAAYEEILLASGRVEEAYRRYALSATQGTSYLATYRALAGKYPEKRPEELLRDLVTTTPGEEGKWFATAKELGLLDEAIRLANETPRIPRPSRVPRGTSLTRVQSSRSRPDWRRSGGSRRDMATRSRAPTSWPPTRTR
jgi:tetratricopeptide (TPR) repeat protein